MNEQPQPQHLPPVDHPEGSQPLYKAGDASSFNGYDLASAPQSVPRGVPEVSRPPAYEQTDLSWEASEYIHHTKSPLWFIGYIGIMLVLLGVAYFFTHSLTFVILVVVMAVAMGVFATRPPRTLHYALTDTSIHIETSRYAYGDL